MITRLIRGGALAILGACAVFMGFSLFYPSDSALDQTHKFERRIHFSASFPFVTSYLIYQPSDINPRREYPVILALHGGYRRSLAAFIAAQDEFQADYQSFVVVPMAPIRQAWSAPQSGSHGALPVAVDIVRDLTDELPIDPDRVYVTGSSMGAIGTFGALAHFEDVFAAGVAVNGAWTVDDAKSFRSGSLAIYHGVDDTVFPIAYTRDLVRAVRANGGTPRFVEMKDVGHDSWPAYSDPGLWRWLFAQRR